MAGPRPLRSTDPRRIGGYELQARLGEGGQGTVFLARGADGVPVAVKLLRSEVVDNPQARRFLQRELEAVARVASFCTARILAAYLEGDAPHLVSEYIAGPSLQDLVAEQGPMSGEALRRLAIGSMTALTAIHEAGVVHRDFKPGNVLLGPDGPRVIDFGVARPVDATTATVSQTVGTPAYMSPEQLSGDRAGAPMDVWAWACTMVYAATGRLAFSGTTSPAVINRIINGEPDLGALEGTLRDLALQCFAKDPAERPRAADVLLRLLGGVNEAGSLLAQGAAAATAAGAPYQPSLAASASATPPSPSTSTSPGVGPGTSPSTSPGVGPGVGPGMSPGMSPGVGTSPGWPAQPPVAPRRQGLLIGAAVGAVVLVAAAGTAVVLLNQGGGDHPSGAGQTSPTTAGQSPTAPASGVAVGAGPCTYLPASSSATVKSAPTPNAHPKLSSAMTATLATSQGTITIKLAASQAPCTVNSFVSLARAGFYTGSPCHRLTTSSAMKVLQCGDPSGTGTGGPPYRFANENATQSFHRGDVAMANAGADATNGSQFFLVAADTQPLGGGYSLFGTITSGLNVLDREEQAGVSPAQAPDDGSPKLPIVLRTVTVSPS